MIMLTSLNGKEFCLNSDLIYKIAQSPDTIITLTDGKVIRVKDTIDEIINKTVEFRRRVFLAPLEGVK